MSTIVDSIDSTVAARVRGERTVRRWSLDELAERASVSKAMISKIERAEASPTAALLGRLSGAFGLTLSALLAEAEPSHRGPVRATDQPVWRDPATGYVRRQVSHVIWVLAGRLTFVEGDVTHTLDPGDSLEFGPPADCTYRNDGAAACR